MKQTDILIVDDEQRYANMLARRLELRGLTCRVRYDGRTALEAIARAAYRVVILDLRLPDMYGVEVLTAIKARRPHAAVIILTGHGTQQDREACLALGACSFINKPLDIERLMGILNQIGEGGR